MSEVKAVPPLVVYAPLLLALFSLPLAFGLIPPNGIYGFRTAGSMASPEAWYRLNQIAGWSGVLAGSLAVIINLLINNTSLVNPSTRVPICIGTFLVAVFATLIMPTLLAK